MTDLKVWLRSVGYFLLRGLVGKYGTLLWAGALALLIGVGAYLSLVSDHAGSGGADRGTVYSVATVDANLARDPGSWLGRTIQLRGEMVPCRPIPSLGGDPCNVLPVGADSEDGFLQSTSPTVAALPIVRAGLDPWRTVLRRAPLLGRLIPASQVLRWGVVGTYTVQLATVPDVYCGLSECVEGRLFDSAL